MSVFGENWARNAKQSENKTAWATSESYLNNLRNLYNVYPLSENDRNSFKKRIESFSDKVHLSAVNEIAFFFLLTENGHDIKPIPTLKKSQHQTFKYLDLTNFTLKLPP